MARRVAPLVLLLALIGATVPASVSGAESGAAMCPGPSVDLSLASPALPGGAWSVDDGCLPPEAFYEVELAGYRLVLALAEVDYDQGHRGRLALVTVTMPDGRAASLVGVEHAGTGLVRWAYAEGDRSGPAAASTWRGEGITDADDAPAAVDLTVHGRGADLLSAPGPIAERVRTLVLDAVSQLG